MSENGTELKAKKRYVYRFIKRTMDIVFSFLGLIILSPVFLITAVCIEIESPGSPIFRQDRAGKDGKPFRIFKFRSMYKDAEERLMESKALENREGTPFTDKSKDDPRITKVGKFIRKTSIDELPQLIDVFRGKMSLVGPRPIPMYEYEAMDEYQRQRNLVKPGLTCIWQVSGRSNIIGQERVELDIRYVKSYSLHIDMLLIIKTIPAILTGKGAQ